MNENENIQTFSEDRFKGLKILLIILAPVIIFFAAILAFTEQPENAADLSEVLPIIFGVFLFFTLITFLILSFQKRKTVRCSPDGFEIENSTFWSSADSSEFVQWRDVADTDILESGFNTGDDGYVSVYSFCVEANDATINLLDLKTSSKQVIRQFIHFVNTATPHLKYIWLPNSQIENKEPIASACKFSKVVR